MKTADKKSAYTSTTLQSLFMELRLCFLKDIQGPKQTEIVNMPQFLKE